MAPFVSRGASARRAQPQKASGDTDGDSHIRWNWGLERPGQASSSSTPLPAGDFGVIDDCSAAMPRQPQLSSTDRIPSLNSVDQEVALGSVHGMHGRPVGVTVPRVQGGWHWEPESHTDDDSALFAPLPLPDASPEASPQTSPRPISPAMLVMDERREADVMPVRHPALVASFTAFGAPSAEGAPEPTSPTGNSRPGADMPGRRLPSSSQSSRLLEGPLANADMWPVLEVSPLVPLPAGYYEPDLEQPQLAPRLPSPRGEERQMEPAPGPGQMKMKMKKTVSFSQLDSLYAVVPYGEIYGEHPKNFHFDSEGNKVSSAPFLAPFVQAHLVHNYDSRYGGFEQQEQEAEPLF